MRMATTTTLVPLKQAISQAIPPPNGTSEGGSYKPEDMLYARIRTQNATALQAYSVLRVSYLSAEQLAEEDGWT